jgi:hypothetical protein
VVQGGGRQEGRADLCAEHCTKDSQGWLFLGWDAAQRKQYSLSFSLPAGFESEDDKESPPRERPENGAPQTASSPEGPPDKCPAQLRGAGRQSCRGRKQGPEGAQDGPPGEGEVRRLPGRRDPQAPSAAPSPEPPVPCDGRRFPVRTLCESRRAAVAEPPT